MFRYYEQVAPIYLSLVKIKYYKIQGDPPPINGGHPCLSKTYSKNPNKKCLVNILPDIAEVQQMYTKEKVV